MRLLFITIFIGISCWATAQQSRFVDSMLKIANATTADTTKAIIYSAIGDALLSQDLQQAYTFYQRAGDLSRKTHYNKGILQYYIGISTSLSRQGYFDSALANDLKAVTWSKSINDSLLYAQLLLNLGTTYLQQEDLENAVKNIEESRSIFLRLGSTDFDGKIFDLLQSLEHIRHQYRKAIDYGLMAVKSLQHDRDSIKLCYAYNNLALNYIELQAYDSAIYFLNKAHNIEASKNDINFQITYNLNLGYIHLLQGEFDAMKPFAERALDLTIANEMHEYQGIALYGIANYYLSKKEYSRAQQYADSVLRISYRHNISSLRLGVLPILSSIAYGMQNVTKGYKYLSQYQALNDSILGESVSNKTLKLEKKFGTERKEIQIRLQQEQLREKNFLNNVLVAGAIGLIIMSILSYRNYKHRQKLQQQRINELETEKQLTATEAILKGEEQERSRLAKDLHDGLGGMLSGIKYSLSNIKENLIMTTGNMQAFEHSLHMLDNSIKEMRRVAHNLMPESLLKFGLDDALNDICTEVTSNDILNVRYQSFGLKDKILERSLTVTIFRIVQELLNNIIKHADAHKAIVQVAATKNQITITVEDDGKGMDTGKLKDVNGIGWSNIQSRVHYHKGTVNIQSKPNKGTSVFIEFPLS